MTVIARKIPALRFPEFTREWEEKRLGEVAVKISDGIHTTPQYDDAGDYFFINGNNLVRGRIFLNEKTKRVNKAEYERHKVVLGENTILLSINGTIGNLAYYNAEKVILGKSACYINLPKEFSKPFIFNILQNHKIQRFFSSEVTGSTIMNLSLATIKSTKINLPSLPEQQKIASFLTTIDTRIQQLSRKKALLEQYKKGVMQQIFSQEIRFKDEDGKEFPAWEEKRLGEIGTTFGGLSGKTKENFGKGKPYITYKQIFDNAKINTSKFDFVEIGQGEKQNRVQYGDVFFTTSSETPNEVGFASVLLEPVDELYLNSFCFGYRPNSFNLLKPDFARFLFRSQQFREMVVKLAQGSTRYNMSKTQLMKLKVSLPAEPEQQKIAAFLSTLDRQITLVSQQLERMQTFKKGLLQQMFV